MRIYLPSEAIRGSLDPVQVRNFQPGPSWVMELDGDLIVDGDVLRVYAGWVHRHAWWALDSFLEYGRIVSRTDLVAILDSEEPDLASNQLGEPT